MIKKKYIILLLVFGTIQFLLNQIHYRWDFTKDQKYSLSAPTKQLLETIDTDIYISIYLSGELPADFRRLKEETNYFLKEIITENKHVHYRFLSPKGNEEKLTKQGLNPSILTIQEDGKISESIIFPWAIVKSKNTTTTLSLLKNASARDENTQIENSIQNLEFAFASGIQKITAVKKQKIAILKGNGELEDIYQYDFLKTLGENYFLAPFTLDSLVNQPEKTLKQLQGFDLAIISKPTKKFNEKEKFALDQFTIHGGKTLWLLDLVHAPKDSLMQNGSVLTYQRDLNLTDYLFNYGIRIKKHLVRDLYAAKIPLAVGNTGNKPQFKEFIWDYYPLIKTNNKHLINKNIAEVKLEFTNSIELLNSSIEKSVLLESSPLSKISSVPNYVKLNSLTKNTDVKTYNSGPKTLGVLLEGNFSSAYKNRTKPFKNNFKKQGVQNKMIVIADGDIASNQISKGKPLELGLDKWSNIRYGNKEFLVNAVNYLLNDTGLIQLRAKKISLNKIDKPKAQQEKTKWQLINTILPLFIFSLSGGLFFFYRKQKNQA